MARPLLARRFTRRRVLASSLVGASGVIALLSACSPAAPAAGPAASAPAPAATSAGAAAASTTAPAAATTSTVRGTLKMAVGIDFPNTLDALKDSARLLKFGAAEGLTRVTPQLKNELWLADRIDVVGPAEWRVHIRPNVVYWDGSPLNAAALIDAFNRNWEGQPAGALYLPKETVLTALDDSTVGFKSPTPIGNFPAALASQYFLIHKPDGAQSMCTGQYRPTQFTKDTEATFTAFDGHWAGKPLLQALNVKLVADSNTRSLALQSGDVDMVYGLSPQSLKSLDNTFVSVSIPSTRVHFLLLNHLKAPFDDVKVAEATSLGIDRASLLQAALDGQGVALTSIFPPNQGVDVISYYTFDATKAKANLDAAGWTVGAGGVREKAGERLAFTLYSYPGRAELTPMAIAIQGQLKPLGYDIQVQEVRDITAQTPLNGPWQIAMNSNDSQSNGDPQRLLAQSLVASGIDNRGAWKNAGFDAAYESLRTEADPAKRQAALKTVQELATSDMANIYLVAGPIIAAYKKSRVTGYTPHPIDLYTVDRALAVTS